MLILFFAVGVDPERLSNAHAFRRDLHAARHVVKAFQRAVEIVDDLNCTLECLDHMAGGVEITAECLGITTTLRIYTNGQG